MSHVSVCSQLKIRSVFQTSGVFHLVEVMLDVTSKILTANLKADQPDRANEFAVVFRTALAPAT
jgi:hypothetical protein